MKLFGLALLLVVSSVQAQDNPPPAEPPGEPPGEAENPVWRKTLDAGRKLATERKGFAIVVVLKSMEDPVSKRLTGEVFMNPAVMMAMQRGHGGVMGTFEDLSKEDQCKGKMKEAGINDGPAFFVVDPTDGKVLDTTIYAPDTYDMPKLLRDLETGGTQMELEEKVGTNPDDIELRLRYGRAMMRKGMFDDAKQQFQLVAASRDVKKSAMARLGLIGIDIATKNWQAAFDRLQADRALLDFNKEKGNPDSILPEGMYYGIWATKELGMPEESKMMANSLKQMYGQSTWARRLRSDGADMGWDWLQGKPVQKAPPPPEDNGNK